MKTVMMVLGIIGVLVMGLALAILPFAKFEMFDISNSLPGLKDWSGFILLGGTIGYLVTLIMKKANLALIFGGLTIVGGIITFLRFNSAVGDMPGGSVGMGLWAALGASVLMTIAAFMMNRSN